MLADVLGTRFLGETAERVTYMAPAEGRERLFAGYSREYPLGLTEKQMRVCLRPGAETWAHTVLPYSNPDDWERFTSIHSDPPGRPTGDPALVYNRFGAGCSVYATGCLEREEANMAAFANVLRALGAELSLEADAPPVVEVTLFHQPDRGRFLVSLLNFQQEQPNVPVDGVRIQLNLEGRQARAVEVQPDGTPLPFVARDSHVMFDVPPIDTLRMVTVDYE